MSATTSLPVPLSPVMSTETSLGAMRSMVFITVFICEDWKTGALSPLRRLMASMSLLFCCDCCFRSSARSTRLKMPSLCGLVWK